MSFSIPQKLIAEILAIAVRVPEGRNTISIIDCAVIYFGDDGLSVSTTSMDNWVTLTTKDFKKTKDMSVAVVPVKALHALISAIDKDQKITLSMSGNRLTVKSGSSKYQFGSLNVEDWPNPTWPEKSEKITLKAGIFRDTLAFVYPSIGRDLARHYLNGINLRMLNDKTLRINASDGHQASLATLALDKKVKLPDSILARDMIALYFDLMGRVVDDTDVFFEISEAKARLEFSGEYSVSLVSRLIEGTYPDIDRLIPYQRESAIYTIPRQAMINALQRINTITGKDGIGSGVKLEFDDGKLRISARNAEQGSDAEEIIKLKGKTQKACIGLSVYKALSLFESFGESVDIAMRLDPKDENGIVIITDPATEIAPEAKAISICMPMKV